MFCTNCGKQVGETAAFCTNCGSPVTKPTTQDALDQSVAAEVAAVRHETPHGVQNAQPSTVAPGVYTTRGCFGSAWDDFFGSEGWLKKLALIGLIMFVPILHLVIPGYAYRWAADAAAGVRNPLPKKIVSGENLKIGFFIFLAGLVLGLALGLFTWLMSYLTGQGLYSAMGILSLIAVVVSLILPLFLNIGCLRIALFDSPGYAFSIGAMWNALKRKFGSAICLTYVPAIVVAISIGILTAIVSVILAGAVQGGANAFVGSLGDTYAMESIAGSNLAVASVAMLLYYWLWWAISCLGVLLQARGAGHYVNRFCPEWAGQANVSVEERNHRVQETVEQVRREAGQADAESRKEAYSLGEPVITTGDFPQEPKGKLDAKSVPPLDVSPEIPPAHVPDDASGGGNVEESPAEKTKLVWDVKSDDAWETMVGETMVGETMVSDTSVAPPIAANSSAVQAASPSPSKASEPEPNESVAPIAEEPRNTGAGIRGLFDALAPKAEPIMKPAIPIFQLERSDGSVCTIWEFPATVGKSAECDVCIPDDSRISREHARILYDDGDFAIEDLGSKNHTKVQGYQIEPYQPTLLSDGDVVKLGPEVLKVHIAHPSA